LIFKNWVESHLLSF